MKYQRDREREGVNETNEIMGKLKQTFKLEFNNLNLLLMLLIKQNKQSNKRFFCFK